VISVEAEPAVIERRDYQWSLLAEPYRRLSLMELLTFAAHSFCRITAILAQVRILCDRGHLEGENFGVLGGNVRELRAEAERLGLLATVAQADRIEHYVRSWFDRSTSSTPASFNFTTLGQMASDLHVRVIDELEARLCFILPVDRRPWFDALQFAEVVAEHFPSSIADMEEAGKCYALGRNTACVFHLMRVTEAGLIAIARRIEFPDDRPMWEPVVKFIDAQLKKNYAEMSAVFKGDVEFLSGIAAQMHAVNLAWRRRVAHVESSYDDGQAKRIFDATKGLMEHIAAKLSEL
jgi:hypothetical protein